MPTRPAPDRASRRVAAAATVVAMLGMGALAGRGEVAAPVAADPPTDVVAAAPAAAGVEQVAERPPTLADLLASQPTPDASVASVAPAALPEPDDTGAVRAGEDAPMPATAAPRPAAAPRAPAPASSGDPARARFEAAFPAHAAATEDPADPASTRWALLIGINDHVGGPRDNYGSRQDAEELHGHLLANGWREDHVLLLTDRQATLANMREAMDWLARKTSSASTAVFHYSGHSKKWYGRDHDGDGEVTDEGLWSSDNGFVVDSELVRRLDGVDARSFWVNVAACEAQGFMDPGLRRAGRVLTFSSTESQKSYEDPSVDNSVWGYYLVDQALVAGLGDGDGDGAVTVQEAVGWAGQRATARTQGQRHGAQTPVLVDDLGRPFSFAIPAPAPRPRATPAADRAEEAPQDEPSGAPCLLCPGVEAGRED